MVYLLFVLGLVLIVGIYFLGTAAIDRHYELEDRLDLIAFQLRSLTEDYMAFQDDILDGIESGRLAADEEPCDCPLCRSERGVPATLLVN